MPRPRVRSISKPQDLRALAHPLRLRLLGALRLDGPATATALARRFGVSSGLTSYHLRALADRGFVEDDPSRGAGRERWWRALHDMHEWSIPSGGDPAERAGHAEAARALNLEVARIYGSLLEKWGAVEPDLEDAWRAAVISTDRWIELTPPQLGRLGAEVEALIERYRDEGGGAGARRVGVIFTAFPDDGAVP